MPQTAEGGGWVISDNLFVFFKNGKRKTKKTKHLRKSSLKSAAYSQKIAAFGVLMDWKAAIFLSLSERSTEILLPQQIDKTMIHVKKLFELAQTQKRFSITWIAEDGHKVFIPDAEFTTKDSFHATNRTMNIKCRQSG